MKRLLLGAATVLVVLALQAVPASAFDYPGAPPAAYRLNNNEVYNSQPGMGSPTFGAPGLPGCTITRVSNGQYLAVVPYANADVANLANCGNGQAGVQLIYTDSNGALQSVSCLYNYWANPSGCSWDATHKRMQATASSGNILGTTVYGARPDGAGCCNYWRFSVLGTFTKP